MVRLSATQLGAKPCLVLTQGSFSDPLRASKSTASPQRKEDEFRADNVWQRATRRKDAEEPHCELREAHSPSQDKSGLFGRRTWMDSTWRHLDSNRGTQNLEREQYFEERHRVPRPNPARQVINALADPPHASVFGAMCSHDEYGSMGGVGRQWRESKIFKGTTGVAIAPPTTSQARVVHVQPHGINKVPNMVPDHVATFGDSRGRSGRGRSGRDGSGHGGHITMHTNARVMLAETM